MARGMGNNIHRVSVNGFEYLAVALNGCYYLLRNIGKVGHCNTPLSYNWHS